MVLLRVFAMIGMLPTRGGERLQICGLSLCHMCVAHLVVRFIPHIATPRSAFPAPGALPTRTPYKRSVMHLRGLVSVALETPARDPAARHLC